MTDKQILIKSMAAAVRGGYDLGDDFFTETPTEFYLMENLDLYFSLIYDHGFAKGFWGDDWKKHLKKMVLSEKPLQYLETFLQE